MNIMASGWGIDIKFDMVALWQAQKTITEQVWGWRKKYQRQSSVKTRTYTKTVTYDLSNIIWEAISESIKDHMIDYAPIDESPSKDDIVLKENIDVEPLWNWHFVIWSDLPYATRRNYENKKNHDTIHYVERAYQNHKSDYDKIAQDIAEEYVDTYISNMISTLRKSSWAKSATNWGSSEKRL